MKIDDVLALAERLGKYLVTVTICDDSKSEGDLQHFAFRKAFPTDDIVASMDASLRSMDIVPPKAVPTVIPPRPPDGKPLKVAIITHLSGNFPAYYSIGHAVKAQGRMLKAHGHSPTLFVEEGGEPKDLGFDHLALMPKFKRPKNEVNEEGKNRLVDVFREHLNDYDVILSHDLYLDSMETHRAAIRDCGIRKPWLHFARSGIGRPIDFSLPGNHRYVYLNDTDSISLAGKIGVDHSLVRYCPNVKDPCAFFDFHPTSRYLVDKLRLYDRDIVQTYALCQTRFDGKGGSDAIAVFAALKRAGKKVCLIFTNANARKRADDVQSRVDYAKSLGLTEEEVVFTSRLSTDEYPLDRDVPNRVIADLCQVSNLMVFPTRSEVCSNVQLEASLSKQLLVVNEDFPALMDFCDPDAVLTYPFTSLKSVHYSGRGAEDLDLLAKKIIGQLDSNKADRQFRHVWRGFNPSAVYYDYLKPLLFETV